MSERWKPERGEKFWYFDCDGRVFPTMYHGYRPDLNLMAFGNMFKTEVEAKSAVENVKALLLSLQEPFTDCNQLPKLTAEVFDLSYFPKTAYYAVVTKDGGVIAYTHKPYVNEEIPCWGFNRGCSFIVETAGSYDSSDWQNSLIERPKKKQAGSDFVEKIKKSGLIEKALSEVTKKSYKELSNARPLWTFARDQKMNYINGLKNKKSELAVFPEWCKVGEWVYSPCCCDPDKGTYFKITQIDGVCIIGEDDVCHVDNAVRARLRPYNSEEMKALVGKVICWDSRDKIYVVESYGEVYGQGSVYFGGNEHSAKDLIVGKYILSDGKPCGVMEHLNENLEWVE